MINVKSRKKIKRKSPGKKSLTHIRKRKPKYAKCGVCETKLNRKKLTTIQIKKLPKSKKRPQRPLPHLCPSCMKRQLKSEVR